MCRFPSLDYLTIVLLEGRAMWTLHRYAGVPGVLGRRKLRSRQYVAPFRKPIGGELSPDQRTYNYHISKVSLYSICLHIFLMVLDCYVRIHSEHAIGLL